jgi:type I restriction enzyme S subunit
MSKYPFVPLGEVCDFIYGDSLKETDRKGGSVPVYGSNGIVGWHDKAITRGETIIVGRKGSIGEVHFSKISCWAIDTTYYIDKTKVPCDFTWLYYTLKALDLTRLNKSAAVPGLNRDDAYEQKIPLPPLAEQKRIASLLARADRLRQLRRAANALADSLLQSVFLEMFGDAETNPKGWDKEEFEKAIISTQNGFGQREDYSPKGIIVLRIRDISTGRIDYSDPRRMIIPEKELAKYSLDHKDLLLVRVNGNPNYVGIASEFNAQNEPIVFSDHIIRVKMDRKLLNTTFAVYLLNSPYGRKQTLGNISTTAGQFTINSSGLSRIKIIFPPLALQEEFARVVARVEGLRARMAEAERQAQNLFESLLAQSFGG